MSGNVTVRVSCLMPERLIERALSQGACFAAMHRPDEHTLVVSCDAASADILLRLCERFSIPATVVSRRGMSALVRYAERRATLAAGLALFAALCLLFLGRVWIVDVGFTGENAALGDRARLEHALDALGVRPGVSRALNTELLAQSLRANLDDYSYVGARRQGVRLLIEAAPEAPAPPLYDVEAARDLVCDRDGIVVSAVARSGELCVEPGDAVRRGQLLIRGEEQAANGETRPIAALGEVVVRAWYEGEAELPLTQYRAVYTGKSAVSSALRLFGWRWPITQAGDFKDQRVETEYLGVGGLYLPLAIERRTCRELRYEAVPADEDRLRARLSSLALADAARRLTQDGPERYALERAWVDYATNGASLRAHAVYEIYTDAAVTREALLSRQNDNVYG